jgi:diacylglycerol O-acyltransferase
VVRLPSPLIAPVVGPLTRGNDLQASNIPGIRDQVYLAGARIERMYTYGPLPGCAAMITMVTHGDTGCVAVNFDAAAFTQPQRRSRPAHRAPDHASGAGGHRTAVHALSPSHCES